MRKTKRVLALYRRGMKALKKINTVKKLERAVMALEQLAKITSTKKGGRRKTARRAYKGLKKRRTAKQKAATKKLIAWNRRNR